MSISLSLALHYYKQYRLQRHVSEGFGNYLVLRGIKLDDAGVDTYNKLYKIYEEAEEKELLKIFTT